MGGQSTIKTFLSFKILVGQKEFDNKKFFCKQPILKAVNKFLVLINGLQ